MSVAETFCKPPIRPNRRERFTSIGMDFGRIVLVTHLESAAAIQNPAKYEDRSVKFEMPRETRQK